MKDSVLKHFNVRMCVEQSFFSSCEGGIHTAETKVDVCETRTAFKKEARTGRKEKK